MSNSILREDPAGISTTLKEAVVDALLSLTHGYISGADEAGKYLYGTRPRSVLNSGFLLPQRQDDEGDEVTSPIWISSHGLQVQIVTGAEGEITVKPNLSVYVRILPSIEDLSRVDCKLSFRLRREVFHAAREAIRNREDEEWEKVKGNYTSRWKHPKWKEIREQIRKDVYTERGLPLTLLDMPTEGGSSIDGDTRGDTSVNDDDVIAGEVVSAFTVPPPGRDEDFEPMAVPHKWLRLDIPLSALVFRPKDGAAAFALVVDQHAAAMNTAIRNYLEAWAASTEGQEWGFRHMHVLRSQYQNWDAFLRAARTSNNPVVLPNITLAWNIQLAQDWLDTNCTNALIALENKSDEPRQRVDETEPSIFLVELETTLPTTLHRNLMLERVEPSYRYNSYLQYPAMGHNGGVRAISDNNGLMVLRTTWAPRYIQPRIVPTSGEGIIRHVRSLAASDGLGGVIPIVANMKQWLAELPEKIRPEDGLNPSDTPAIEKEKQKFQEDLGKWKNEIASIEAGITILQESRAAWNERGPQSDARAIPFEAWLGMNEAMANFMKKRFKNDNGEWRLFQLAFIIANIPSLASRIPAFRHHYDANRDDSVTLLYFATGGGKSEAFFGLLLFNLLLDRLRGKKTGVTAMIRYPLRLLTIQQAQRCSKVLAQAELIRRKYKYGGDALSIGFWVGSGGSPNSHGTYGVTNVPDIAEAIPAPNDEAALRDTNMKYEASVKAWNKIPECPFCSAPTALRRFVAEGGTLAHVCTDIQCESNQGTYRPLPFYICDEDIYDLAPSVLLGTVDKLALIGHSAGTIRRIYGMFGAAPWRRTDNKRLFIPVPKDLEKKPHECHCEGLWPAYPDGVKLFDDPFPSLLIQDEAHLLDESLGTFAGLFESTLDAIFHYLADPLKGLVATDPDHRRRRAKVIAASATVNEPERQLEHLYQRQIPASQFPHPGPSLYESFYAQPAEPRTEEINRAANADPEVRAPQARVYTAFMTNGKPHTATSVAILSNFHLCISRLTQGLVHGDATTQRAIVQSMKHAIKPGPLQELHRQVLGAAPINHIATLVDLHRIALTYVTNKKGGDQIMAAELEETRKRHMNVGVPLKTLDTRLITGSVDQGEVQAVVRAAQERDVPGSPFTPLDKVLRSVIATSAISHGVDVEEFNSMFFAGMPSDIAEYIQASSRVGRTHIGFVVLIPTPQRRRDRYIVEVFDIFHRFLERMVSPAAIDRWAEKAVERVFPSLLQAYLVGIVPSRELIKLPEVDKRKTPNYAWIPALKTAYQIRQDAMVKEITSFIELAIGLKQGYFPEGETHYRKMIEEKTRHLLNTLSSGDTYNNSALRSYFQEQPDAMNKPMTSLRDVDQGGHIRMAPKDAFGNPQKPKDVFAVMDLVRNGVAENDDEEA